MRLYYVSKNTRLYRQLQKINMDCIERLWDLANDALSVVMDSYFLEKNMKPKSKILEIDGFWCGDLKEESREKICSNFIRAIFPRQHTASISETKIREITYNLDNEFFRVAKLHMKLKMLTDRITSFEIATALEKNIFNDSRKDLDSILGILCV